MSDNAGHEDHYEVLQLSPNADQDTIQRVFRLLAKRYHPDNPETGDAEKFNQVQNAYEVLSHTGSRASYDARYYAGRSAEWKIFERNTSTGEEDRRIFQAILSILYMARRQNSRHPGLGILQIERVIGCPPDFLEFHIWYLKEKGWIDRIDNGQLAITVNGVEKVSEGDFALRADRLLVDSTKHRRDHAKQKEKTNGYILEQSQPD